MSTPRRSFLGTIGVIVFLFLLDRIAKPIMDVEIQDFWKNKAQPSIRDQAWPYGKDLLDWVGPFWSGVAAALVVFVFVEIIFLFAKGNPESRHATATPKKRHYRKSNILFKNKNLPFEKFGSLIRLTHYPPTKSALSDVVLLIVYGYEQLFEKPAPEEDVISETRRALSELSGQELDWRLAVLSRNVSSLDYAANCLQRGDIELINNEAGKFFQITAFGRDRAKAIIKEMQ